MNRAPYARLLTISLVAVLAMGAGGCGDDGPSDEQVSAAVEKALTDTTSSDDAAAIGEDTVAAWLDGWCKLSKGMKRDRAVEVMGEPTTEYSATEAAPQLNWETGAYHFTAFMDTDGVLGQLQANYEQLGATDRAKLKCPEMRK